MSESHPGNCTAILITSGAIDGPRVPGLRVLSIELSRNRLYDVLIGKSLEQIMKSETLNKHT